MSIVSFCHRVLRWMFFPGPFARGERPVLESPRIYVTGPELINRIVEAIDLNQSVVLSGPRGCGKSYCIRAAIDLAMERGILPTGAKVILQGNREIPRDYLLEDDITFRVLKKGEQTQVIPERRSAPLFAFATRSETGDPECDKLGQVCLKEGWWKFVLFLDEINRFSDGVLDGLLSILEERKAVLAGIEYRLPVVVCMTMNPPGYDGSARRLSPPLAARIGRTYRLVTPDLDTLTDLILRGKLDNLREAYDARREVGEPEFPNVPTRMLRRIGLTTLCLWGEMDALRMGNEYLTPDTRELLQRIADQDGAMRHAMRTLSGLCQFGPDGRAGADWLTAAIGLALSDAQRNGMTRAVVTPEHLTQTAVVSLAHKIYDNFSPASRPDLTATKERAVTQIAAQVLTRPWIDRLITRDVDDDAMIARRFPVGFLDGKKTEGLANGYRKAGVVDRREIERWDSVIQVAQRTFGERSDPVHGGGLGSRELGPLVMDILIGEGLVEDIEPPTVNSPEIPAGFNDVRHDALARDLARRGGFLGTALQQLLEVTPDNAGPRIGAVRPSSDGEVRTSYMLRCLTLERFQQLCEQANVINRRDRLTVCRMLEVLWGFPYAHESVEDAVARLENECPARTRRPLLLAAVKLFLPHELLKAFAVDREAEVVPMYHFLLAVRNQLGVS
jgi:MoxR-like ATPase